MGNKEEYTGTIQRDTLYIVLELGLQWATRRSSLQETTQDFRESNTELYGGIY